MGRWLWDLPSALLRFAEPQPGGSGHRRGGAGWRRSRPARLQPAITPGLHRPQRSHPYLPLPRAAEPGPAPPSNLTSGPWQRQRHRPPPFLLPRIPQALPPHQACWMRCWPACPALVAWPACSTVPGWPTCTTLRALPACLTMAQYLARLRPHSRTHAFAVLANPSARSPLLSTPTRAHRSCRTGSRISHGACIKELQPLSPCTLKELPPLSPCAHRACVRLGECAAKRGSCDDDLRCSHPTQLPPTRRLRFSPPPTRAAC